MIRRILRQLRTRKIRRELERHLSSSEGVDLALDLLKEKAINDPTILEKVAKTFGWPLLRWAAHEIVAQIWSRIGGRWGFEAHEDLW